MTSNIEHDIDQAVTLDPPLKRFWGLFVGLLVALMVSYALWGQPFVAQSDNQPDELESMSSQLVTSTQLKPAKAVPNVGVAVPQDWWQSPAAQAEANKRLITRLYGEGLNAGSFEPVEPLFAADFTYGESGDSVNRSMYWQTIEAQRAAYHDLRYQIEDMIVDRDRVVVRWLAGGTPKQTFETHPPTGDPAVWRGITIWQVTEGKIVSGWTVAN